MDLLFSIVLGMARLRCAGYNPLPGFIQNLAQNAPISWHRDLFFAYLRLVRARNSKGTAPTTPSGSKKKQSLEQPPTATLLPRAKGILPLPEFLNTADAHYRLLAHLILPCAQHALEKAPGEFILPGGVAKSNEQNSKLGCACFISC